MSVEMLSNKLASDAIANYWPGSDAEWQIARATAMIPAVMPACKQIAATVAPMLWQLSLGDVDDATFANNVKTALVPEDKFSKYEEMDGDMKALVNEIAGCVMVVFKENLGMILAPLVAVGQNLGDDQLVTNAMICAAVGCLEDGTLQANLETADQAFKPVQSAAD